MAHTNAQIAHEARRRTKERCFLAARPEIWTQNDAHLGVGAVSIQGAAVEEPMVERLHGTAVPQEA